MTSSNEVIVNQSAGATSKLIYHFSDWHRLRTALGVFLRVKKILKMRCKERINIKENVSRDKRNLTDREKPSTSQTASHKDTEEPYSPPTIQDLVDAEFAILKFVQNLAFGKEIHAL